MNKINILCIPSDSFGVGSFRYIEPHIEIQKQFPDEFNIEINMKPNFNDINYLEKFDIIFGNKDMLAYDFAKEIFPRLQAKGIKIIMDVDDHWNLHPTHPQYHFAKQNKYAERVQQILPLFDYVTTTTPYFQNEIKKYNKNVTIFPNGVDPTSKKFKIKEVKSDKIRIGFLGGSSHLSDLQLLKNMFNSINFKYKDKVQTVLCGYDLRGTTVNVDQHGNRHERPILPKETCWYEYEKIFTSNYQYLPQEYKDWLLKFKQEDYPNVDEMPYHRVWTKPLSTYSLNYNLFDISLAPLVTTPFNLVKSELKCIEAGFFKKALIASDIAPYQGVIKHGENGFLVNNSSTTKDWTYYVKTLIENPDLVKKMGENLYESVKDKYDLRNISRARAEWYKEILGR